MEQELKAIELMIALSQLVQMWIMFLHKREIEKNTAITKQVRNNVHRSCEL
ncbi:hypothetical protein [Scytonema sp. NUACC26]|uniref:hypothetical protein n=1 Tax=Scytonema sp. NUACC26 TaxID=3140176 RepID=UPI0034DBF19D